MTWIRPCSLHGEGTYFFSNFILESEGTITLLCPEYRCEDHMVHVCNTLSCIFTPTGDLKGVATRCAMNTTGTEYALVTVIVNTIMELRLWKKGEIPLLRFLQDSSSFFFLLSNVSFVSVTKTHTKECKKIFS